MDLSPFYRNRRSKLRIVGAHGSDSVFGYSGLRIQGSEIWINESDSPQLTGSFDSSTDATEKDTRRPGTVCNFRQCMCLDSWQSFKLLNTVPVSVIIRPILVCLFRGINSTVRSDHILYMYSGFPWVTATTRIAHINGLISIDFEHSSRGFDYVSSIPSFITHIISKGRCRRQGHTLLPVYCNPYLDLVSAHSWERTWRFAGNSSRVRSFHSLPIFSLALWFSFSRFRTDWPAYISIQLVTCNMLSQACIKWQIILIFQFFSTN